METKNELANVEKMLHEIRNSYRRTSAVWLMLTVVFVIFAIFFISYAVKYHVYKVFEEQNISTQIEEGFDKAISNYEIDQ